MFQLAMPEQLLAGEKLYSTERGVDKVMPPKPEGCRLVVVLNKPLTGLPDNLKQMVEKLVAACKIDTKDVAYMDSPQGYISFSQIASQYRPQAVLVFGNIKISRNLTGLKTNLPYEFNGTKILFAGELEKIDKTPTEKKALWAGLQQMFGL